MSRPITTNELKKIAKPIFRENYETYYPVATLKRLGFERAFCSECGLPFWRASADRNDCGDCQCAGGYSFIRTDRQSQPPLNSAVDSLQKARRLFEASFATTSVPHTVVPRYPVVARWRDDVDFVGAGIYCFQPFCVNGEAQPPANPLVCAQPCLRFNDLDNIGLTGRHYSCFFMLGVQVFNRPEAFVYFKEEAVEYNVRFLTEGLGVPKAALTLVEDVWAGGGNLGPSIEYFVGGLEIGNSVFMQFRACVGATTQTPPAQLWEELEVKVIDVGIGLERIPWLLTGASTSYALVFRESAPFVAELFGTDLCKSDAVYRHFARHSYRFNVDEVDPASLGSVYQEIAELVVAEMRPARFSVSEVVAIVENTRDVYICCDHARTLLVVLNDGALPSNEGGCANVRNVLRRLFAVLDARLPVGHAVPSAVMDLFGKVAADTHGLAELAVEPVFLDVLQTEYTKYKATDNKQLAQLRRLQKKRPEGRLALKDWVVAVSSYGLAPEFVRQQTGQSVPPNLYLEISLASERTAKVVAASHNAALLCAVPSTELLYFSDAFRTATECTAKPLAVLGFDELFCTTGSEKAVLFADRTVFYPTSGGQLHDVGSVVCGEFSFEVVDAVKLGSHVAHVFLKPLALPEAVQTLATAKEVVLRIDETRRELLRKHHTGTHVLFSAARAVLGRHVWQNGAKKTPEEAHLDITHFAGLSVQQVAQIEEEANRRVLVAAPVRTYFLSKSEAERRFGFTLYQGGVVPGDLLRIVDIAGFDVEACCGTHCATTAEVGLLRVTKTSRVSDGTNRLVFTVGERAVSQFVAEKAAMQTLLRRYNVPANLLAATIDKFFDGYKRYSALLSKREEELLRLRLKTTVARRVLFPVVLATKDDLLVKDANRTAAVLRKWAHASGPALQLLLVVCKTFFLCVFRTGLSEQESLVLRSLATMAEEVFGNKVRVAETRKDETTEFFVFFPVDNFIVNTAYENKLKHRLATEHLLVNLFKPEA